MRKENKYVIAFDAYKNFREIRIMDDPNEPFTIGKDMAGGSIYVFTQKEFKKLIESAMRHITEPVGVDPSENINLATGDVGRVKDPYGGSPMQFSLSGLAHRFIYEVIEISGSVIKAARRQAAYVSLIALQNAANGCFIAPRCRVDH